MAKKIGSRRPKLSPSLKPKVQKSSEGIFPKFKAFARRNKSRIAVYGLSAALMFGTLKYRHELPYLTRAAKPIHIGLVFGAHTKARHASPIIEELEFARKQKRPYHIVLVESSAENAKDFEADAQFMNKKLDNIRQAHENLLSTGLSYEDARNKLRQSLNSQVRIKGDEFRNEVYLGLALEGVRMMPAERYEEKEISLMRRINLEIDEKEEVLDKKLGTNAPLSEIRNSFAQTNQKYLELGKMRDTINRTNLHNTIARAKRLFPALAKEKELRVLTQFGTYHSTGLSPKLLQNKNTYSYEAPVKSSLSVAEYAGRMGADVSRSSMFDTIGYYIDETLIEMARGNAEKNIPHNPEYAKRIYYAAIRTTPQEFEALSRVTQGMNYNDRANYLLNYFLKKK